jgi:RimJ/RimL family protein N-acetyltransferase
MAPLASRLAAAIPDDPRWIDIRGMLLSGHAEVTGGASLDEGFVIRVAHGAVSGVGVVGRPDPHAIAAATDGVTAMTPVVCQQDNAEHVRAVLTGWISEPAIVHTFPSRIDPPRTPHDGSARLLGRDEHRRLDHLPAGLRHEMNAALDLGPVAAVFVDGRPVSFCYPVWRTERWWDVSIDTLEGYRGRGIAIAAVRLMVERMRDENQEPIWSALESNGASLRLAQKIGFVEVDRIVVLSRDGRWTLLSGGFQGAA